MKSARRTGNGRALHNLRPVLNGARAHHERLPEDPERARQREEYLARIAADIDADMRATHEEEWRNATR